MVTKKLKVLVVDDSAFMRLLISDILSEDPSIEVSGSAVNGREAVQKVKSLKPDVVVLDMNMGEYDGIYAVKNIMCESPVPILILSAVGNTDLEPIFDALKYGAVDYMNKPSRANSKMRVMNIELINKIKSVARARPQITNKPNDTHLNNLEHTFDGKNNYDVIAIGASTGGPSAIEEVIMALPANLNVPVIICQHMPANFIRPFVERLNKMSPLNVVIGTRSMIPRAGMIVISPGDSNLILEKEAGNNIVRIGFSDQKYPDYNHPSINAMMHSVAQTYGSRAIGVILTGMGKDGVTGLKAIKEKGGYTIAQNRESCVIYGMPKAAVDQNAVARSMDIKEIGSFLVNCL